LGELCLGKMQRSFVKFLYPREEKGKIEGGEERERRGSFSFFPKTAEERKYKHKNCTEKNFVGGEFLRKEISQTKTTGVSSEQRVGGGRKKKKCE